MSHQGLTSSWVISSLIRLTKWIQSIECGCDGCFICLFSFLTRQQILLLNLGLCPTAISIGSRPPKDMLVSSGSSGVIVSLYLQMVAHIFLRIYSQCFLRSALLALSLAHLSIFSDSCPPTIVIDWYQKL